MYNYEEFRLKAIALTEEHKGAIDTAEKVGKELAKADAKYHRELACTVPVMKGAHGATVAEAIAKGEDNVAEALEQRDILRVRERAALERIRLARDDRATLLLMGRWARESSFEE